MKKLRASGITQLLRCPREYVYGSVMCYAEEKAEALSFGSAFHACVEGDVAQRDEHMKTLPNHKYPYAKALEVMKAAFDLAWLTHHSDKVIVGHEIQFFTETFTGTTDGIAVDTENKWYIVEHKTAYRLDEFKKFYLRTDVQMNAYVVHRENILEAFYVKTGRLLDPDDFAGVLYTQTIKPGQRLKKGNAKKGEEPETPEELGERLTSECHIWFYSPEDLKGAVQNFAVQQEMAVMIRDKAIKIYEETLNPGMVMGNPAACIRYNRPCPFATHCYPDYKINQEKQDDVAQAGT